MLPSVKEANPVIELVELTIRKDRKNYIVCDVRRQEYYEMPEAAVEAVRGMQQGRPLPELEAELRRRYPDEEIDLAAFVRQLQELGLVRRPDGAPGGSGRRETTAADQAGQAGRRHAVPAKMQRLGRILYHPAALAVYVLFFAANLAQLLGVEGRMPQYADLFVSASMMRNMLAWALFGLAAALLHECGHTLAMAARGLPTRWRLGHRWVLPVLETEMNGVWSLPASQRYVPYLAGMCVDQVLLFAVLALQGLLPESSGLQPWLRMFSLHLLLVFGYQLLFFLKTDLYYVVENASGSYNLKENAVSLLRGRLRLRSRDPRQQTAEPVIFEGERAWIRAYALLYAAGVGVGLLLIAGYLLPQMIRSIRMSLPRLGLPVSEPLFWDAAVFCAQLLIVTIWLVRSWLRAAFERREGRADRSREIEG
jgi:hypothetical protein